MCLPYLLEAKSISQKFWMFGRTPLPCTHCHPYRLLLARKKVAQLLSRQQNVVVVQLPSCVQVFTAPWTAARQASLSLTIPWSLHKFISIESVMPSNHLILSSPLLLPSIFPAPGSFPMSRLFASGGQSIRASASASASVLPKSSQVDFI